MNDSRYPRDYTDRQLLESIWRRIDGLAVMLAGPIYAARRPVPEAHPDDIADMIRAWTPPEASRDKT